MTLADRLNKIIAEQNISKQDFAARVGISRNYLYILTGNSGKNKKSPAPLLNSLLSSSAMTRNGL